MGSNRYNQKSLDLFKQVRTKNQSIRKYEGKVLKVTTFNAFPYYCPLEPNNKMIDAWLLDQPHPVENHHIYDSAKRDEFLKKYLVFKGAGYRAICRENIYRIELFDNEELARATEFDLDEELLALGGQHGE